MIPRIRLITKFPCCGGKAKIVALCDLPREIYSRKCSCCGQRWEVERRTARVTEDRRVDILEWTPQRARYLNVMVTEGSKLAESTKVLR